MSLDRENWVEKQWREGPTKFVVHSSNDNPPLKSEDLQKIKDAAAGVWRPNFTAAQKAVFGAEHDSVLRGLFSRPRAPVLVGIVFNSEWFQSFLREIEVASHPVEVESLTYGGVPVFEKRDQAEPCKLFYSRAELHEHLKAKPSRHAPNQTLP